MQSHTKLRLPPDDSRKLAYACWPRRPSSPLLIDRIMAPSADSGIAGSTPTDGCCLGEWLPTCLLKLCAFSCDDSSRCEVVFRSRTKQRHCSYFHITCSVCNRLCCSCAGCDHEKARLTITDSTDISDGDAAGLFWSTFMLWRFACRKKRLIHIESVGKPSV